MQSLILKYFTFSAIALVQKCLVITFIILFTLDHKSHGDLRRSKRHSVDRHSIADREGNTTYLYDFFDGFNP